MKRTALILLVSALLLFLSASCAGQGDGSDNRLIVRAPGQARVSETVVIQVNDEDGRPVAGASFVHGYIGGTGTTDQNGEVATFFSQPGTYEYTVSKQGFSPATGKITIVPGTVEFTAFGGIHVGPPPLPGQAPQSHNYRPGMPVQFRIKNIGSKEITMPDTAPWRIDRYADGTIFTPVAAPMVVRLAPGEIKEWQWQQQDNNGAQVGFGPYLVVLRCSEGEYRCLVNIVQSGVQ